MFCNKSKKVLISHQCMRSILCFCFPVSSSYSEPVHGMGCQESASVCLMEQQYLRADPCWAPSILRPPGFILGQGGTELLKLQEATSGQPERNIKCNLYRGHVVKSQPYKLACWKCLLYSSDKYYKAILEQLKIT